MTRNKFKLLTALTATAPKETEYCDGTCFLSDSADNLVQLVSPENSPPATSDHSAPNFIQANSPLGPEPISCDNPDHQFSTVHSWVDNQSHVPPSVSSDDSDQTDAESIIFDLLSENFQLSDTQSTNSKMEVKELAEMLSAHNKEQADQWNVQILALTKALDKTHSTPPFSATNSLIPKFSGSESEDVTEFLANFNRAARFYKFSEDRKAEALPLYLTSTASIWFNTTPGLAGQSFDYLADALKKQFHTDSDVWLLRQKLHDRKQLPTESVSDFAASIRRLCQRLNLPRTECVNVFIQNLKPELKHYVILQRPETLEQAEMHARLKESLPDPKPVDRFDELLDAITKLHTAPKPTPSPVVAAYRPPTRPTDSLPHPSQHNQSISRDDVTQMIRQELPRASNQRFNGPNQRGRRTFDGRPICDFCSKPGHIMAVCRQRQNQRRDPRISFSNRPPRQTQPWGQPQPSADSLATQTLN